jgi:hypothetical protein
VIGWPTFDVRVCPLPSGRVHIVADVVMSPVLARSIARWLRLLAAYLAPMLMCVALAGCSGDVEQQPCPAPVEPPAGCIVQPVLTCDACSLYRCDGLWASSAGDVLECDGDTGVTCYQALIAMGESCGCGGDR